MYFYGGGIHFDGVTLWLSCVKSTSALISRSQRVLDRQFFLRPLCNACLLHFVCLPCSFVHTVVHNSNTSLPRRFISRRTPALFTNPSSYHSVAQWARLAADCGCLQTECCGDWRLADEAAPQERACRCVRINKIPIRCQSAIPPEDPHQERTQNC